MASVDAIVILTVLQYRHKRDFLEKLSSRQKKTKKKLFVPTFKRYYAGNKCMQTQSSLGFGLFVLHTNGKDASWDFSESVGCFNPAAPKMFSIGDKNHHRYMYKPIIRPRNMIGIGYIPLSHILCLKASWLTIITNMYIICSFTKNPVSYHMVSGYGAKHAYIRPNLHSQPNPAEGICCSWWTLWQTL